MRKVLLIHPPVVKPGEPPAGLARLAGALKHHNIHCTVVDANLEGLLFLLNRSMHGGTPSLNTSDDTWTKRARFHLEKNLYLLRRPEGYINRDRYKRMVLDINRILQKSCFSGSIRLSLSNYEERDRSPLRSSDLIDAAKEPDGNPYYGYFKERLPRLLAQGEPSWVGFSLNYLSQALCCFAMIGVLKQIHPGIKIVLGGGLVTSWMRRADWGNPFRGLVDECIAGPGEGPLLALLGTPVCPEPTMPEYSDFPLVDYLSPGLTLPYSASAGCYWRRCSFCPEKAEGSPYRPIPDGRVLDEMGQLAVKTAPSLIHILDNAIRPSLLKRLIADPPGIPWYGFARIAQELADADFCKALKHAGCVMLKLGIESGSQRVLDALEKGIDLDTAEKVLSALKQAGIAAYVYLLFGTPAESVEDALQTLEFTARHRERIDFLNVAVFNLPCLSRDAEILETTDFYDGDLSLYRMFVHPSGWDRSSVRRFLDREFKRHPAIAPVLRRDPPSFTSNHAPFFMMFR